MRRKFVKLRNRRTGKKVGRFPPASYKPGRGKMPKGAIA